MAKDIFDFANPVVDMVSGKRVDLTAPLLSDFDFDDIARGQAMVCRYNGAVEHFYSNAQHTVIASYIAQDLYGDDMARAMLGSLCADYYLGIVSDAVLKLFPEVAEMRTRFVRCLFEAFGNDTSLIGSEKVKHVNDIMEAIVYRDLRPNSFAPWSLPEPDPDIIIHPMTAVQGYFACIARFRELWPDLANRKFEYENDGAEMHLMAMT